jgi:hypothetical protein
MKIVDLYLEMIYSSNNAGERTSAPKRLLKEVTNHEIRHPHLCPFDCIRRCCRRICFFLIAEAVREPSVGYGDRASSVVRAGRSDLPESVRLLALTLP